MIQSLKPEIEIELSNSHEKHVVTSTSSVYSSISKVTSTLIVASVTSNASSHSNLRPQRIHHRSPCCEVTHLPVKPSPRISLTSLETSHFYSPTCVFPYLNIGWNEEVHLHQLILRFLFGSISTWIQMMVVCKATVLLVHHSSHVPMLIIIFNL